MGLLLFANLLTGCESIAICGREIYSYTISLRQ